MAIYVFIVASPALAVLDQTASDLYVLEDQLRYQLERQPELQAELTPMLLSPPQHHWRESREGFAPAAIAMLKGIFNEPESIIECLECDTWRLHVQKQQRLMIHNGPLSLVEVAQIQRQPRYANAKTIASIRETPSGVELRITSLKDGRILFFNLADSSQDLDGVRPWSQYGQERDRRQRGESLSYVFINMGLYPKGLFQVEFLEQWGSRNQHISGVGVSLYNPNFSLGIVYHYMIPSHRRLHVSGSLYYPLQNALQNTVRSDRDLTGSFVGQGMVQYTFANSYGAFASISTEGILSVGFNFYNPLFLPFLL